MCSRACSGLLLGRANLTVHDPTKIGISPWSPFLLFISQPLFSLVTVSFIFHLSSRSLTCLSVCIKNVSEPSQFTNRLTSVVHIIMVSVFSSFFPLSPLLITHHLECDGTAHFHVNSHSFVCFLLLFQCTIRSQSPQACMHLNLSRSRGFHIGMELANLFN